MDRFYFLMIVLFFLLPVGVITERPFTIVLVGDNTHQGHYFLVFYFI